MHVLSWSSLTSRLSLVDLGGATVGSIWMELFVTNLEVVQVADNYRKTRSEADVRTLRIPSLAHDTTYMIARCCRRELLAIGACPISHVGFQLFAIHTKLHIVYITVPDGATTI